MKLIQVKSTYTPKEKNHHIYPKHQNQSLHRRIHKETQNPMKFLNSCSFTIKINNNIILY